MGDLPGRLRCCAGISPQGSMTRLRPEARMMMDAAADEIERLTEVIEEARFTNRRLHRRAQTAESEAYRKAGRMKRQRDRIKADYNYLVRSNGKRIDRARAEGREAGLREAAAVCTGDEERPERISTAKLRRMPIQEQFAHEQRVLAWKDADEILALIDGGTNDQ